MAECARQRLSPVRLGSMGVGSVSHHHSPISAFTQTLPVIQINSKPQNDSPAASLLPVEQLLSSVAAAAAAAAVANNNSNDENENNNSSNANSHLNGGAHLSNVYDSNHLRPGPFINEEPEEETSDRLNSLRNTRHVSASLDSVVARTNDLRLSPLSVHNIGNGSALQNSISPLLSSSSSSSLLYPLPAQPVSAFPFPFGLGPFGTLSERSGNQHHQQHHHLLSPDCDVRRTFHASNSSLSSTSSLGSSCGGPVPTTQTSYQTLADYNNNLNNPYNLHLNLNPNRCLSETLNHNNTTTSLNQQANNSNMSGVGVATHPLSPLVSNSTNAPSNASASIASTCSTAPGQVAGLSLVMSSSTGASGSSGPGANGMGQPIPLQTSGSGDSVGSSPGSVPASSDQFRNQYLHLKHQQQIQQQLLFQQFQVQQAQLNEHHEKQLQEHIREYLEQKQRLEEEQARLAARQEAANIAISKLQRNHSSTNILASGSSPPSGSSISQSSAKKSKPTSNGNNNGSACASQEVKQKLAEFVLAKRQREAAAAAAAAAGTGSGTGSGGVPLQISKVAPWLSKYDNDFPLRKTASEPNLKVRSALKAKVIQRRSSPLLKRKDKPSPLKRRTMSNDMANGIPENSCSPPSTNGTSGTGILSHQSSFHSSSGSTPIQEVQSPSPFGSSGLGQSVSSSCAGSSVATGPLNASCDLEQLYSSPSLPNISLGRPHHPIPLAKSHHEKQLFNAVQQATVQFNDLQMRAALARSSIASVTAGATSGTATGTTGTTGFFPSLPVIEGEFTPPISPSFSGQAGQGMGAQLHGHQSSGMPAFPTPAMAAAGGFTAAALANTAALFSYATAAAAVGIPLPLPGGGDQAMPQVSTTQAGINSTTSMLASSGSQGSAGAERIRPTAALHAARLVQRPLGRTQSAPLPLGHPALLQTNAGSTTTVSSSGSGSTTANTSSTIGSGGGASSLVKQQIRAAVLQRTSSKSQMAVTDVEEETEAAVAAEEADAKMTTSELDDQVMDLTSKSTTITGRHSSIGSSGSCPTPPQQHFFQNQHSNYPLATSATIDLSSIPFYHRHHLTGSSGSLHQTPTPSHLSSLEAATSALSGPFESSIAAAIYQRQLLAAAVAATQNTATPFRSPFVAGGLHGPLFGHHFGSHVNPGRPLSRTLSSPQVMLSHSNNSPGSKSPDVGSLFPVAPAAATVMPLRFTTALVYDSFMQKHQCSCADAFQHPEHGGRLQSIWARLQETGLVVRCERIRSRKATLEEIQQCHSEAYTLLFGSSPHNRHKIDPVKLANLPIKSFVMLPCGGIGVDSDTTWNELHSAGAARMAAGCVTELALKVANKEVKNGFAIVRPPGSHAEHQQAMGFCFFNSIAIAVKQLKAKTNLKRILIVDWDVHHGNGLQQMFYDDPDVLYISLHRHDEGNFFPGTGDVQEIGSGAGVGFNVNIAWTGSLNPPLGDAEYLAAFRSIVMPIARQFDPELVMIACGFDAAVGHAAPLGGYNVSPACFGWMTQQLLTLAEGRLVMALEGGYELAAICDSAQICVSALLGDPIPQIKEEEVSRKPAEIAISLLNRVIQIQSPQWSNVRRYANLIACDALEAVQKEREECETVNAMASLTMKHVRSPESEIIEEPMDEDISK